MSGLGLTTADLDDLAALYQDLHRHPELSFQETRTAGLVAKRLRGLQFEVTEGVGRTGVVGLLRNGAGPTVLLRADMDALPVEERTDLPYASTVHTVDAQGTEVAVMHACGHDLHVTCLLGACVELARRRSTWSGTVMAVFQPAEEVGGGARAMIDDDLFGRFGSPVVVLGQHVTPLPAGVLGLRSGAAFAAADSIRITLHGRGAHGSRPETSVDPVVMAAAVIMRLQTVVSRDVAATDTAVVTVGAVHAGTAGNIIPDRAQLLVTVRTFRPEVRTRILASIERIVRAEAAASGADRTPDIELMESFPRWSTTTRQRRGPDRPWSRWAPGWWTPVSWRGARTSACWRRRPAFRASTGCWAGPTRRSSSAPIRLTRSPSGCSPSLRTTPRGTPRSCNPP